MFIPSSGERPPRRLNSAQDWITVSMNSEWQGSRSFSLTHTTNPTFWSGQSNATASAQAISQKDASGQDIPQPWEPGVQQAARHPAFSTLPWQTEENAVVDKKSEYVDNADRVEVEQSFSPAKCCCGLGKIMTKLDITTHSSIALSILVMNVACLRLVLWVCFSWRYFQGTYSWILWCFIIKNAARFNGMLMSRH